jgi:hypothetical protein
VSLQEVAVGWRATPLPLIAGHVWAAARRMRDDGRVRVLMPLPDRDFDVTEVAVPWRVLSDAGHQVVFATEQAGTVPAADPRLLTGVIFGQRPPGGSAAITGPIPPTSKTRSKRH